MHNILKYQEYLSRVVGDPPEPEVTATTTGVTLQINNVKLYVPVATLLMNDNITFSEYIKQGFKSTIPWNKYRPELKK